MPEKLCLQIILPYNLQLHEQSILTKFKGQETELVFSRYPSQITFPGPMPQSIVTVKMSKDGALSERDAWLVLNRFLFAYKSIIGDYFNGELVRELTFDRFKKFLLRWEEKDGSAGPVSTESTVRQLNLTQLDKTSILKIEKELLKLLNNGTMPIDLFETLLVSAKTFLYDEDYRMCVLECATALDVYLAYYLRPKLTSKGFGEKEIDERLNKPIQPRLLDVFEEATGSKCNKINMELYKRITNYSAPKGFYNLRNEIIHEGATAAKNDAMNALEIVSDFKDFLEDLEFSSKHVDLSDYLENLSDELKQIFDFVRAKERTIKEILENFDVYSKDAKGKILYNTYNSFKLQMVERAFRRFQQAKLIEFRAPDGTLVEYGRRNKQGKYWVGNMHNFKVSIL